MAVDLTNLENANCCETFSDCDEMQEFLTQMVAADMHEKLCVNTIYTGPISTGELGIKGLSVLGLDVECPIFPVIMTSLEKRSGDNAKGHEMMSDAQILNSMNNYWKLHANDEQAGLTIRGGKALLLESAQYVRLAQNELFDKVLAFLNDKYTAKYSFVDGFYTHASTEAKFELKDAISETYKVAWRNAGLQETLLNGTKVFLHFRTNDIATSVARVTIEMSVMGTRFMLGDPINIVHREGHGSMEEFQKSLNGTIVTVQEELDALAKLMSISLTFPEQVTVRALKHIELDKISKKAAKELVDDMLYGGNVTAYTVYLYLHGFLSTASGNNLSEDRKFRVVSALRKLLSADWAKWDASGSVTL